MKKGRNFRQRLDGRERNQESKMANRLDRATGLIKTWEKLRGENQERNYDEYVRKAIDEYTAIIGEL